MTLNPIPSTAREFDRADPEEWRGVPGQPDYQASTHGRVRRVTPPAGGPATQFNIPYIIHPIHEVSRGTPSVCLTIDRVKDKRSIARIVAETYIDNPESLPEVTHRNGILTDNHVSNLKWSTRPELFKALQRAGRIKSGEKLPQAKLTAAKVKAMRIEYAEAGGAWGLLTVLALRHNVSISTARSAISGVSWREAGGPMTRVAAPAPPKEIA